MMRKQTGKRMIEPDHYSSHVCTILGQAASDKPPCTEVHGVHDGYYIGQATAEGKLYQMTQWFSSRKFLEWGCKAMLDAGLSLSIIDLTDTTPLLLHITTGYPAMAAFTNSIGGTVIRHNQYGHCIGMVDEKKKQMITLTAAYATMEELENACKRIKNAGLRF